MAGAPGGTGGGGGRAALSVHVAEAVSDGLQEVRRQAAAEFAPSPWATHTFISHALAGGRTLAEVRDAAGHSNVTVTSGYLHVAVEDDGVGELFA